MREVAIVSPVRTAVGNFGGGMRDISAAELRNTVYAYPTFTSDIKNMI